MTDTAAVASVVREALISMPLASAYVSEQRDLQPCVEAAVQRSLRQAFPAADLRTTISVGGTGKPNLKALGTSFWPDVEIAHATAGPIIAIEVKRIRATERASKPIAETIGQSVIYSIRYPHVFAFVVHYGRCDDLGHDEDAALDKRLALYNVALILRRVSDTKS
jgi:hypothetical protein